MYLSQQYFLEFFATNPVQNGTAFWRRLSPHFEVALANLKRDRGIPCVPTPRPWWDGLTGLPLSASQRAAISVSSLDVQPVVDEHVAEAVAQVSAVLQRGQRFSGKRMPATARPSSHTADPPTGQARAPRDAVEPRMDLRRHIEIRIGERLADTVLQMRRGIAGLAGARGSSRRGCPSPRSPGSAPSS